MSIFDKIVEWSTVRGIIASKSVIGQVGKFNEEVGETQSALVRSKLHNIKDGVGDALVIMTNVLAMEGYTPERAINLNAVPRPSYANLHVNQIICGINYKWSGFFWEEAIAIAVDDLDDIASDVVELLAELARRYEFTLAEALDMVFAEIEPRVGIFYNETFIKQADFTDELLTRIINDPEVTPEVRDFAEQQLVLLNAKKEA